MNDKDFALNEQFSRMSHLLLKERLRSFQASGPDGWRKRLLALIKAHPEMTMKELIEILSRRMPAGEELLLGLEQKGYIAIKPIDSSDDKAVELTELGLKEVAEYQSLSDVWSVLSDDEKTALGGFLARMIDELQKKAGSEEDSDFDRNEEWVARLRGMCDHDGFNRMRKLHEHFMSRKGPHGHYPYDHDLRAFWG